MRRPVLTLLALMLLATAAPALAERAGGTFTFLAPYSGDLFGMDAHKSTRVPEIGRAHV
jgi:hypothetical protein